MQKKINEIKIGDISSEEIININGKIIIKAKEVISDDKLKILQIWGIDSVEVNSSETTEKELKEFKNELIDIPTTINLNEYMQQIIVTAEKIKAIRYSKLVDEL